MLLGEWSSPSDEARVQWFILHNNLKENQVWFLHDSAGVKEYLWILYMTE